MFLGVLLSGMSDSQEEVQINSGSINIEIEDLDIDLEPLDSDLFAEEIAERLVAMDAIEDSEKDEFQQYVEIKQKTKPTADPKKKTVKDQGKSILGAIKSGCVAVFEGLSSRLSSSSKHKIVDVKTCNGGKSVSLIIDQNGKLVETNLLDVKSEQYATLLNYYGASDAQELTGTPLEQRYTDEKSYLLPTNTSVSYWLFTNARSILKEGMHKTHIGLFSLVGVLTAISGMAGLGSLFNSTFLVYAWSYLFFFVMGLGILRIILFVLLKMMEIPTRDLSIFQTVSDTN